MSFPIVLPIAQPPAKAVAPANNGVIAPTKSAVAAVPNPLKAVNAAGIRVIESSPIDPDKRFKAPVKLGMKSATVFIALPHPVNWRMLTDSLLYLDTVEDPDDAYDLRVFYDQVHKLAGLDGAAATTLSEAQQSALIFGAAGYAAVALAMDKVDTVAVGGSAAADLRKWGWARILEFRQRIGEMADREVQGEDSRIGWWPADKWDDA